MNPPEPVRRCWAEIDLDALRHNVAVIRGLTGPGTDVMAVVKADAYGHGLARLVPALLGRVDLFGVANVTEALQVRQAAPGAPVLILGPALPEERATILSHGFLPVISSVEEAQSYAALVREGPPASVHLAVDTGMGRIGAWQEEAVAVAKAVAALPGLRLAGVGTHLPVADEDTAWTRGQLAQWNGVLARLAEAGLRPPAVHALNSAGTIRFHGEGGGLVRTGLMLYGCSPLAEFQPRLRPVLAWKSRITLLRHVPGGRGVSYGRTFITPRPMTIATVGAGYADGYPRHLSNAGAEVLVGGQRCPVLGRVTMDQILVDVSAASAIPPAVGDEVVFLGRQGAQEILAAELAEKAGTIPWEIFTGITRRVTRHYRE